MKSQPRLVRMPPTMAGNRESKRETRIEDIGEVSFEMERHRMGRRLVSCPTG